MAQKIFFRILKTQNDDRSSSNELSHAALKFSRFAVCLFQWLPLVIVPAFESRLVSAETTPAGGEFFEKKIRPLLVDHCYSCHSAKSEKIKGGLLLDTRDGLLKGGDSGPALVPGKPDQSRLIKAVRYTDKELQMPPKDKRLAAEQIADLEAWVKMGAPDPRTNGT